MMLPKMGEVYGLLWLLWLIKIRKKYDVPKIEAMVITVYYHIQIDTAILPCFRTWLGMARGPLAACEVRKEHRDATGGPA